MRLSVVEYGPGLPLSRLTSEGHSIEQILEATDRLNKKISDILKSSDTFVAIKENCLFASKIAGVMELEPGIDLEIIPKFLENDRTSDWKSTVYFLSLISKYGFLLDNSYISSGSLLQTAFYDISGRILAEEYTNHSRKPIRIYEKVNFKSFTIDGELIFESYLDHDPDGFGQNLNKLSIHNEYNDTIVEAMRKVVPYVLDARAKRILSKAIESYGNCPISKRPKKGIPNNNKDWSDAYYLSCDILNGFANALESGKYHSPSFVVSTWQIWEWLITTGLKTSFHYSVKSQESIRWGSKITKESEQTITVNPDVTIYPEITSMNPVLIVDAKYKKYSSEVSRQDLYEVMAFCQCTHCRVAFLLYPDYSSPTNPAGTLSLQSHYLIGDNNIFAMTVCLGKIFSKEEFHLFGLNLSKNLVTFLKEHSVKDPELERLCDEMDPIG